MSVSSWFTGFVVNSFFVLGGVVASVLALAYFYQESILYIPYPSGLPRTPKENPRGARSPAEYAVTLIDRAPRADWDCKADGCGLWFVLDGSVG